MTMRNMNTITTMTTTNMTRTAPAAATIMTMRSMNIITTMTTTNMTRTAPAAAMTTITSITTMQTKCLPAGA